MEKEIDDEVLEGDIVDADDVENENEPSKVDEALIEDTDLEKYMTPRQRLFCKYYATSEEVL
jgi:hypothetical protein